MSNQEILKKQKEEMIQSIKWSIDYHERKLAEEKAKLEIINKSNI